MPKPSTYHSFLLRIWQTGDEGRCTWRASLERPDTRERHGFATLEQLFDFLRDQTTSQSDWPGIDAGENPHPRRSIIEEEKESERS